MEVNEAQKTVLFDPIRKRFNGDLQGAHRHVGAGIQAGDR